MKFGLKGYIFSGADFHAFKESISDCQLSSSCIWFLGGDALLTTYSPVCPAIIIENNVRIPLRCDLVNSRKVFSCVFMILACKNLMALFRDRIPNFSWPGSGLST